MIFFNNLDMRNIEHNSQYIRISNVDIKATNVEVKKIESLFCTFYYPLSCTYYQSFLSRAIFDSQETAFHQSCLI